MRSDIQELTPFVGGHPETLRLAVKYAANVGIDVLRRTAAQFADVLTLNAIQILKHIRFTETAQKICIALLDFRRLLVDDLVSFIEVEDSVLADQLVFLESHGVLERVGRYYRIAPYVADAISRSDFAGGYDSWRRQIGAIMLARLKDAASFDNVSLSLIDAATLTAIRTGKHHSTSQVARFLLPSHLLRVAREEYDERKYMPAVRLCQEALGDKDRLTVEAQIECTRIIAMSSLRMTRHDIFVPALESMRRYRGRTARRNEHFLQGFKHRLQGHLDEAEAEFRRAHSFDARNFHVLRELSHVLLIQDRYGEAEQYARAAYGIAPTNPFVIDGLCEVIIGARAVADLTSDVELQKLLRELRGIATSASLAFAAERTAELDLKMGNKTDAWRNIVEAVDLVPHAIGPRVTRLEIALRLRRYDFVEADIKHLESSLKKGDDGYTHRCLLDRARISVAIDRHQFASADQILATAAHLPKYMRSALEKSLAVARKSAPPSAPHKHGGQQASKSRRRRV